MPLPDDWSGVDWQPSVIVLPRMTENYPLIAISSLKYPKFPAGYYMMAFRDSFGQKVVGYNAKDVGSVGPLVSEFVFMHEVGHHRLHHQGGRAPGEMEGVTYTHNKELDADQFACEHWLSRENEHGVNVVEATLEYFRDLGGAAGDAEHPPAAERYRRLQAHARTKQLKCLTIYNDNATSPDFVRDILVQCFGYPIFGAEIGRLIQAIEREGKLDIRVKANGRVIGADEAARIASFTDTKAKFAGARRFRMTVGNVF